MKKGKKVTEFYVKKRNIGQIFYGNISIITGIFYLSTHFEHL